MAGTWPSPGHAVDPHCLRSATTSRHRDIAQRTLMIRVYYRTDFSYRERKDLLDPG